MLRLWVTVGCYVFTLHPVIHLEPQCCLNMNVHISTPKYMLNNFYSLVYLNSGQSFVFPDPELQIPHLNVVI